MSPKPASPSDTRPRTASDASTLEPRLKNASSVTWERDALLSDEKSEETPICSRCDRETTEDDQDEYGECLQCQEMREPEPPEWNDLD